METSAYRISERVRLSCVYTGRKFKSEHFSVNFFLPLSEDTSYLYSLLPGVLNSGCRAYPTQRDICIRLEELYGTDIIVKNAKYGIKQHIGFTLDLIADRYTDSHDNTEKSLDLLYEIIGNPLVTDGAFDEKFTEIEKRAQTDKIRAESDNKISYALKLCIEKMCEGETYGIPLLGTEEKVRSVTPRELYLAYRMMLDNAYAELVYVGETENLAVIDFAGKIAKLLPETQIPYTEHIKKPMPTAVKTYVGECDMVQSKLTLGFRLAEQSYKNRAVLALMSQMLAYAPSSKLFVNVREKLALCYYCKCILERENGLMFITSGLESSCFDTAKDAILKQIYDIAHGDFSDAEFSGAVKSVLLDIKSIEDSSAAVGEWTLYSCLRGDGTTTDVFSREIAQVGRDDISSCAAGIFPDTEYRLAGTGEGDGDYDDE